MAKVYFGPGIVVTSVNRYRRTSRHCGAVEGIWVLLPAYTVLSSSTYMLTVSVQLATRKLVLFAVNNNPDCTMAEGGSHW